MPFLRFLDSLQAIPASDRLAMSNGFLETRSGLGGNATQTSVEGLFAAGDVADQH